uniref:Uncharacterized protein LOC108053888 n=1 Tax=Drosophila rhopaloa TaxID=1041015 RepID=A0A6P4G3G2_DRORH
MVRSDLFASQGLKMLTYNDRGKLVHEGFTFSCHTRNPEKFLAFWRCTMYKKMHCSSALTTYIKSIKSIRGFHNHQPPERLKTFVPRVLDWQSRLDK